MELIKTGMAGTVESGDILVEIEKTEPAFFCKVCTVEEKEPECTYKQTPDSRV